MTARTQPTNRRDYYLVVLVTIDGARYEIACDGGLMECLAYAEHIRDKGLCLADAASETAEIFPPVRIARIGVQKKQKTPSG